MAAAPPKGGRGGRHERHLRSRVWFGRAPGYGSGLRTGTRRRARTQSRNHDLRNQDRGSASPARLAGAVAGKSCGDGIDRRVLETGVLDSGRGIPSLAGERGAYQERAGAQDRCQGRLVDQLLECGLLRGSFVPPRPIREIRDLTRYRKRLIQQRTEEVLRLHGVLQRAGIKLSSVARNILGVSGRAMLDALVKGNKDAAAMSELARGALRGKIPLLQKALQGNFTAQHGLM